MAANTQHSLASIFLCDRIHSHSTNITLQVDSLSAQSCFSVTWYVYKVLEIYELPLRIYWESWWTYYGQPYPALTGSACATSWQLWGSPNFFSSSQQSTELRHVIRGWCIQLEAWEEQTNNTSTRWQTSATRKRCFPRGKSYNHKHELQRKW